MNNLPGIALGTWSWGSGKNGGDMVFGNHLDEAALKSVYEAAMDNGLNLWDTAAVYGIGASETILGSFLKNDSRSAFISTKFTPSIAGDGENPMADMCAGSRGRLGCDSVDIYWIHNASDVERWTPMLIPLVKSGKVRAVGVSNHNLRQIKRAQEILGEAGIRLSAVQNHYSLLYRGSEDAGILDYCQSHEMRFFSYMVLEQGALGGKYDQAHPMPADSQRGRTYNPLLAKIDPLISELRQMAKFHHGTPAQIAMAWAIGKGTIPIIGVTSVDQVEEAAAAARIRLSPQEIARLEKLADAADADTKGFWENRVNE